MVINLLSHIILPADCLNAFHMSSTNKKWYVDDTAKTGTLLQNLSAPQHPLHFPFSWWIAICVPPRLPCFSWSVPWPFQFYSECLIPLDRAPLLFPILHWLIGLVVSILILYAFLFYSAATVLLFWYHATLFLFFLIGQLLSLVTSSLLGDSVFPYFTWSVCCLCIVYNPSCT